VTPNNLHGGIVMVGLFSVTLKGKTSRLNSWSYTQYYLMNWFKSNNIIIHIKHPCISTTSHSAVWASPFQ
jgi:hypothetical protein